MLYDLLDRASVFRLHFTGSGIYPNHFPLGEFPRYSIFHLSGSAEFQAGLFVIGCLAALLFTLGIATRFAGIICWVFLLNLQHYTYFSQFSADDVLRLLLFWSLFLPLDARLTLNPFGRHARRLQFVENWASAALLAQVAAIFIFAGTHKLFDPEWRNGNALQLAIEACGTPFATSFLDHSALLSFLTLLTIPAQLVSSFLLFTSPCLRRVGVSVLIGFQIALLTFLNLSFFPAVTLVGLLLFIPDTLAVKRLESWNLGAKKSAAVAVGVGLLLPIFGNSSISQFVGLHQNWSMFVPPPHQLMWVVTRLHSSDGRVYEAATKREFTDWSETRFATVPAWVRWAGLFLKIPQHPTLAHRIGISLCRYWKEDAPEKTIVSAHVYLVIKTINQQPHRIHPELVEKVLCNGD